MLDSILLCTRDVPLLKMEIRMCKFSSPFLLECDRKRQETEVCWCSFKYNTMNTEIRGDRGPF